ncbi:hypothetical protein I204_08450 [Kwoniella mangroviensis CBS 8886]|nr:hypothetical protein I204_08450 [Kwoniella mangroviensis CBS 8886]
MPTPSTRRDLLKKIQSKINQTRPKISLPYYHSWYLWLLSWRRNISSSRYWDRLPAYWSHDYLDEQHNIVPSSDKEALKRFRCTLAEFNNLVREFGDDPVFKSKNNKAQATPHVQIGVLLHRLAYGHSVGTIARTFGLPHGSIHNYTQRALYALAKHHHKYIYWPSAWQRDQFKQQIQQRYGIPGCVGYIDGVHIVLKNAPSKGKQAASAMYSYKGRYGWNLLVVCDPHKRIRYFTQGFTASTSDSRVQRNSTLQTDPDRYFSPGEYVLGDAGFTCTPNVIPLFKCERKRNETRGAKAYFNYKTAKARVTIEHTFGILKGRWEILKNASLSCKTEKDEARLHSIVKVCCMLHNMLVGTWAQALSSQERSKTWGQDRLMRHRVIGQNEVERKADWQRRRDLISEMLELEPREVNVDDYTM